MSKNRGFIGKMVYIIVHLWDCIPLSYRLACGIYSPPAAHGARPINPYLIGTGNCTTHLALCAALNPDALSLYGTYLLEFCLPCDRRISTIERIVRTFGQERSELLIDMRVGHEGRDTDHARIG